MTDNDNRIIERKEFLKEFDRLHKRASDCPSLDHLVAVRQYVDRKIIEVQEKSEYYQNWALALTDYQNLAQKRIDRYIGVKPSID